MSKTERSFSLETIIEKANRLAVQTNRTELLALAELIHDLACHVQELERAYCDDNE